jgi:hypothetical protein
MLPAWFIIYEHKGQHNTILVNGETGKVVCGVPWSGAFLCTLYALVASALSTFMTYFLKFILEDTQQDFDSKLKIYSLFAMIGGVSFYFGIKLLKKVYKSLGLTRSRSVYNFVKRRQGES